jgi:formylglycine-generating enzyme required for sulfatase activity
VAEGLRLLTFDEWEYACGAGSTTLFRWGDFRPSDFYPTNNLADWKLHLQPNLFGLHIAQNP